MEEYPDFSQYLSIEETYLAKVHLDRNQTVFFFLEYYYDGYESLGVAASLTTC